LNVTAPDGSGTTFLAYSLPLSIDTFSPSAVKAGGPSFNLTISGGLYPSGTLVLWNDAPLSVTSTSLTQIAVSVPASLIGSVGYASIAILQPGGSQTSNYFFAGSGASILSTTPLAVVANSPDVTLTLTGGGFASGAAVRWNQSPLATNFVSSTQLTALVPACLLTLPGYAGVDVVNPGGYISNLFAFTVQPSGGAVSIADASPGAALSGTGDVTVTIVGSGFKVSSSAFLDGVALSEPAVLSDTQMTATIPASLLTSARSASLTVSSGNTTAVRVNFFEGE